MTEPTKLVVSPKPRVKVGSKGGAWGGLNHSERMAINASYEGASRTYRMGNKGMSSGGPNSDSLTDLTALKKRSRHIIKNNPLGENAVTTYVSNVIGKGITAKFEDPKIQLLWDHWCQECDADGLSNFNGILELMGREEFVEGEAILRRRFRKVSDGFVVPLQIQMLSSSHLDPLFNDQFRNIQAGIQYDNIGSRYGYHLFKNNPEDYNRDGGSNTQRTFVKAEDVVHLFRRLRIGQSRGIPKLANILVRLYEIDEMQDGMLAKQKIAQLFGWIVRRPAPKSEDFNQENNTVGEATGETTEDGTIITGIKSGGVHYLDEGEEVDFSTPDGIGSNYIEWLKQELRVAAKGIGLTYEQFTGDLTGVNYSSIRAGLIEFRRSIEQVTYNLYVYRLCRKVAEWFLDAAIMSGKVSIPDYWSNKHNYLPKWKAQGWDWVDPIKDRMGDLLDVRAGFNSRRGVVDARGEDFDKITKELMEDFEGELILDSIPSKTDKTGAVQSILEMIAQDDKNQDDENQGDQND